MLGHGKREWQANWGPGPRADLAPPQPSPAQPHLHVFFQLCEEGGAWGAAATATARRALQRRRRRALAGAHQINVHECAAAVSLLLAAGTACRLGHSCCCRQVVVVVVVMVVRRGRLLLLVGLLVVGLGRWRHPSKLGGALLLLLLLCRRALCQRRRLLSCPRCFVPSSGMGLRLLLPLCAPMALGGAAGRRRRLGRGAALARCCRHDLLLLLQVADQLWVGAFKELGWPRSGGGPGCCPLQVQLAGRGPSGCRASCRGVGVSIGGSLRRRSRAARGCVEALQLPAQRVQQRLWRGPAALPRRRRLSAPLPFGATRFRGARRSRLNGQRWVRCHVLLLLLARATGRDSGAEVRVAAAPAAPPGVPAAAAA